jgi:hypothetical protein
MYENLPSHFSSFTEVGQLQVPLQVKDYVVSTGTRVRNLALRKLGPKHTLRKQQFLCMHNLGK